MEGEKSREDNPEISHNRNELARLWMYNLYSLLDSIEGSPKIDLEEKYTKDATKKDGLEILLGMGEHHMKYLYPDEKIEALGWMAQAEIYLKNHQNNPPKKEKEQ